MFFLHNISWLYLNVFSGYTHSCYWTPIFPADIGRRRPRRRAWRCGRASAPPLGTRADTSPRRARTRWRGLQNWRDLQGVWNCLVHLFLSYSFRFKLACVCVQCYDLRWMMIYDIYFFSIWYIYVGRNTYLCLFTGIYRYFSWGSQQHKGGWNHGCFTTHRLSCSSSTIFWLNERGQKLSTKKLSDMFSLNG